MESRPVRVLLIDDDEDDFVLTRELLTEIQGLQFHLDWARNYEAGQEALARPDHDVVLLDYWLNGRTGLELLSRLVAQGLQVPVIVLTGKGDRDIAIEAMKAGAADYLIKGKIDPQVLERSIRFALERRRAAEALRKSHEELERRVAERTAELSQANLQLAEADRRKDEFLAMLAHELRNPLAPVQNALEYMRLRPEDAAACARAREMAAEQVRHLARLVDDLLDASRITQRRIHLRKEIVDLARIVNQAVDSLRPTIAGRGQELTVALPAEPIRLEADPTRLLQVLYNLLNNAMKYTKEGGRFWLSAERDGEHVVLRVRDTGIGMSRELLPRIFDLFTQGERGLDRAQGGLGIGLTMVRSLVEMHGGTVQAHSDGQGRGSEFIVRLPILTQAPPPADQGAKPRQPSLALCMRILVVDDNVSTAQSMAALLQLQGHDTRTAFAGSEAIEAAADFHPQVVLLDIGMPEMDGYQVAQRLRQMPGLERTLLVALSGYGQDDDFRRSREAGFQYHLVKPVRLKVVEDLLAAATIPASA